MTEEDLNSFILGDEDVILRIAVKYNAHELSKFCDEVFDGNLTDRFMFAPVVFYHPEPNTKQRKTD